MIKQSLNQKQLQKLSPQQIQLMKLLQVPTAIMEQRIKEELEENPALEEVSGEGEEISMEVVGGLDKTSSASESSEMDGGSEANEEFDNTPDEDFSQEMSKEDSDFDDYLQDDGVQDYKTKDSHEYNPDDEEKNKTIPVPIEVTFHENLTSQLGLLDIDEHEFEIAEQIIGSIDDDGYLRREIEAIVDDLSFSRNITATEEEVQKMVKLVQTLEPAGVGAIDLRECLLIQLNRKKKTPTIIISTKIIEKYFEAFTKKHYERLMKDLNVDEDEFKKAIQEIVSLNPKPGGGVANVSKFHIYITPDFLVTNNNDSLTLSLNSINAPELRVSNDFKEMLRGYKNSQDKQQKEALMFLKQKLDSAKWFIDAIKQRQNTMLTTMEAILKMQHAFFLSGDESDLRPMILKDIAEITNFDISTISRVANSKYVQTEFGTYLLKFFFSEGMAKDSGEEVSTREIKKLVSDIVSQESKKKPLSDEQLKDMLMEKGYNIARRTVAKYREQIGIPVARMRKEV
jgi:RNA polymerase sigma-54 factor